MKNILMLFISSLVMLATSAGLAKNKCLSHNLLDAKWAALVLNSAEDSEGLAKKCKELDHILKADNFCSDVSQGDIDDVEFTVEQLCNLPSQPRSRSTVKRSIYTKAVRCRVSSSKKGFTAYFNSHDLTKVSKEGGSLALFIAFPNISLLSEAKLIAQEKNFLHFSFIDNVGVVSVRVKNTFGTVSYSKTGKSQMVTCALGEHFK